MDRSLTTFHNVPWMSLEFLQETEVDAGEIWVWPDRTDVKMMVEDWCEDDGGKLMWDVDDTNGFFGCSDGSKFSCAMALAYSKLIKIARALRCWGPVRRSCALQSTHHTPVSLAGFCSCSFGSRPATCGLWFRKCGSYVSACFIWQNKFWYVSNIMYICAYS